MPYAAQQPRGSAPERRTRAPRRRRPVHTGQFGQHAGAAGAASRRTRLTRASARTASSTVGYAGTAGRQVADQERRHASACPPASATLASAAVKSASGAAELTGQRRREDHDQGVHPVVDGGVGERVGELVRAGLRPDVRAGSRRRPPGPAAAAGGGGQPGQGRGVADHPDPVARPAAAGRPAARRRRTARRRCPPGSRRSWANSAVTAAASGPGGRRRRRADAAGEASATTGLLPADPPGQPGELARVAEGLQVAAGSRRCPDRPASTGAGRCRRRRPGCRPRRSWTAPARAGRPRPAAPRRTRRTG